jgi:hypothetical protein
MGETGIFNCNIELTARGFEGLFVDKDNSKANIDFADGKGEVEITLNDFSDRFEDYLKLPNIRKCIFRDN